MLRFVPNDAVPPMPKKLQRKVQLPKAASPAAPAGKPGGPGFPGVTPARRSFIRTRVRPAALADFTSQFATLLEAGIPVVRSLYVLEGQLPSGVLKRTLGSLAEDVEGGTPLSEALGKFPQTFDNLYTNMVRAGEAGGIQDVILQRLASFMETAERIKSKVRGALAYPIAVVIVASIVLIVVMTYVVPRFKEIFKTLIGEDLPPQTQLLISLSDAVRQYWWAWGIGLPLLYAVHRTMVTRITAYRRGRDRVLLRIPLFGQLIRKTIIARFARTFGTLVESGVPHLEALEIVKASVRNRILEEAIDDILASIREGEGIWRPMGESGIFDDLIVNMVDVGEQTGELDRMLIRIADRYEREVDRTVEIVFKTIEPILILVLAVFVGFIVYALLSPMLRLMQKMGRRGA